MALYFPKCQGWGLSYCRCNRCPGDSHPWKQRARGPPHGLEEEALGVLLGHQPKASPDRKEQASQGGDRIRKEKLEHRFQDTIPKALSFWAWATLTAPHSPGRGTSPLHFLPFPGPEMLCPVLFKRHVTAPPRPSYQKHLPSPFLTQEHLQLPPVPSSLPSSVSRDHVP